MYTNDRLKGLNRSTLRSYDTWKIYKQGTQITGHWRNQIKEEIRLDRSKKAAKKDNIMWGLCTEEIEWGRMRKTSGNKTIKDRIAAAKLMNGRRATNTFLKKFGITATDTCSMCGVAKETNRHILCYCTNDNMQNARKNTGTKIAAAIKRGGGTVELQIIFKKIYNIEKSGRATTMNGKCYRKGEWKTEFPAEWKKAWNKGKRMEKRTWLEEGQGRAAEIAMTMGGATPLWTGNITKAWMWLLGWGRIPAQNKMKLIKEIRTIIAQTAAEVWKCRCKVNDTAILEHKTGDAKYSKQMARQFISQLKLQGQVTVNQVIQLTAEEKMRMRDRINRKWEDGTKQQSLLELDFTREEQEIPGRLTATTKRTLGDIVEEANGKQEWIQTTITGLQAPEAPETQNKRKKKRNKKEESALQPTVVETFKWNTLQTKRKKPQTACKKVKRKTKRFRGKRDDVCVQCEKGGFLVECDTCSFSMHPGCDLTMPTNAIQALASYKCPWCMADRAEEGKTDKGGMKPTQKDSVTKNTRKEPARSDKGEVKTTNTQETQEATATMTSRVQHQTHDTDEDGIPDLLIQVTSQEVVSHIQNTVKGEIVAALGDGHCLRRSLGKITNISPGEVVRKMQQKSREMRENNEKMRIESDSSWYEKAANPETIWLKLETNVKCSTPIYGGHNELLMWSIIIDEPIIVLNAITGTAMSYEPTILCNITEHTQLNDLHQRLTQKYTKQPKYILYNNSNHYNSVLHTTQEPESEYEILIIRPKKRTHNVIETDSEDEDEEVEEIDAPIVQTIDLVSSDSEETKNDHNENEQARKRKHTIQQRQSKHPKINNTIAQMFKTMRQKDKQREGTTEYGTGAGLETTKRKKDESSNTTGEIDEAYTSRGRSRIRTTNAGTGAGDERKTARSTTILGH